MENITTIEELAGMVNKGFNDVKADIQSLRTDMNKQFDEVYERFDKIEKLILEDHKRRIENLEKELKELKGLLAI